MDVFFIFFQEKKQRRKEDKIAKEEAAMVKMTKSLYYKTCLIDPISQLIFHAVPIALILFRNELIHMTILTRETCLSFEIIRSTRSADAGIT